MSINLTKKCSTCKKIKEITEFNKNITKPDGFGTECKECIKIYRKNYYSKNKINIKKKVKNWQINWKTPWSQ